MCGIAGFSGGFGRATLEAMTEAIKHRGPDGSGYFFSETVRVGLGHRRLAIIDLSPRGLQPMWDSERRVVVTFNGEIYNFKALRLDLQRAGYRFISECDTEVICNGYLHYGLDVLRKLEGMFAFALWDSRSRELLIARDAFGVKPLYYSQGNDGFVFSSELKSLLHAPGISRQLCPEALLSYVTLMYCPGPLTPLTAVKKVLPGEFMLVRDGSICRRGRFDDRPTFVPQIATVEEACDGLVHQLRRSISEQMVSDVPVGAFLSGGLDSSAIVRFASDMVQTPLKCFTIVSDGSKEGFADDLPYARSVARKLGVDLVEVPVEGSMLRRLEELVYHLDEPQGDPASLNVLYIAEAARAAGVKVLLSGAGGDDLFSGYRRHHAIRIDSAWGWLPLSIRALFKHNIERVGVGTPLLRRLARATRDIDQDPDRRIAGYFSWLAADEALKLFSDSLRPMLGGYDPLSPFLASIIDAGKPASRLEAMLHLEQQYFLPDHNLNYTDKMSMAAGVEVRVPYLDSGLLAFARRLPATFKQRGSQGKWIFKKAMEPYLPRAVIYRPKTGFGAPLREWMHSTSADELNELLGEDVISKRGIFDPDAISRMRILDRESRVDAVYPLFAIACIEMWCRLFVD